MKDTKKALVVSDTHHNKSSLNKIIERFDDVDYLFHLGDNTTDAEYLGQQMPHAQLHYVRGNCDPGSTAPDYEELLIGGRRIILTHGHLLHTKSGYDRAYYYALEKQADALLFGHTHTAYKENVDGIWLINPGSAGAAYTEPESVALLLIGEYGIVPKLLPLDGAAPMF